MTVRRINHTGRQKIRREDVEIQISDRGPRRSVFTASLKLAEYALPSSARVFVEAYAPSICQRFEFGLIGDFRPPKNSVLSKFDSTESVKFRVKVVKSSNGDKHILAEADQLSCKNSGDGGSAQPLLPVDRSDELGSEVFRLEGLNEFDGPVLKINGAVGDWKSVSTSPVFVSLAFPGIIRQILCAILVRDSYTDIEDTENWRSLWLLFATSFAQGVGVPDPSNETAIDDWIEDVVSEFSRHHDLISGFKTSRGEET